MKQKELKKSFQERLLESPKGWNEPINKEQHVESRTYKRSQVWEREGIKKMYLK